MKIPDTLWQHPLFTGTAWFPAPTSSLAASQLDSRIRKIRSMPSTSDASGPLAVKLADRVLNWGVKWLDHSPDPETCRLRDLIERVARTQRLAESGTAEATVAQSLSRILRELPPELASEVGHRQMNVDPTPQAGRKGPSSLPSLSPLLHDYALRNGPATNRRYWKRMYRAVDQSLDFNATTDSIRNRGLLQWIRETLEQDHRRDCDYLDVGCAVAAGAPNVALAAQLLRPGGLCRHIHGVDIVKPSPELVTRMRREAQALLYQADPVHHRLPRQYDIIVLANVHRHLTPELQRHMFTHLGESLTEHGTLFISWRFDDQHCPALVLRRTGQNLSVENERNVAEAK